MMGTKPPLCWSRLGGPDQDGKGWPRLRGSRMCTAVFLVPAVGPVPWGLEEMHAAALRPWRQPLRMRTPERGGGEVRETPPLPALVTSHSWEPKSPSTLGL